METQIPHTTNRHLWSPAFVGGLVLFIAGIILSVMWEDENVLGIVGFLLMPVVFFVIFWILEKGVRNSFAKAWHATPFLSGNELPDNAESKGLVLRNIMQTSGRAVISGDVLSIIPIVGRKTVIDLSDIEDFKISSWFNGSYKPKRYGITLTVKGLWRLGFTVDDIEPWRSLLMHHIDTNHNKN